MIHDVLVPLDTSSLAEAALPHVLALAHAFNSRVHLLSVVERPGLVAADSVDWRLSRDEHEAYLGHIAAGLQQQGVAVESEIVAGTPAEQILEVAGSRNADLVVLTTHGCGGMTEFRLSGTVSKVLSGVETSVLVVRPENAAATTTLTKIFAPVDCSQRGDWAVCLAAQIARAQGAELLLVTVVEPPHLLRSIHLWTEQARLARRLAKLNRDVAEQHLEDLAQQIQNDQLRVVTRVIEETEAAKVLQRVADEEDCSLVVLSAHGHSPSAGWSFGSVTRGLLEHCNRPVLVFQDARAAGGTDTGEEAPRTRLQIAT